jgi:hypothetical protein
LEKEQDCKEDDQKLPVEMCKQLCEEHYTKCQHSALFVLNGLHNLFNVSHYTSDIIFFLLPHEFQHQHSFPVPATVAISFLAGRYYLQFFDLHGECDSSLVSTFTNKPQVLSPHTHMM